MFGLPIKVNYGFNSSFVSIAAPLKFVLYAVFSVVGYENTNQQCFSSRQMEVFLVDSVSSS